MAKSLMVPRALLVQAQREADHWRSFADKLLATMQPAKPIRTPAGKPKDTDVVREAIKEESGGDSKLAAYYSKRARQLRKEGKSDGDIAAEIRNWNSTEASTE